MEKALFRQRVFLMCASDRDAVDRLNQVAHQPKYSGISLFRLKTITSPPTLFHASEEKQDALNREEEYWRSVGEEGEIGVNATRFTKKARKSRKPKLFDAETANFDLDERPVASTYWLPVNQHREKDILCMRCKHAETFAELDNVEDDARYCINCSANNQSQYKRPGPELGESQALMILAARLKTALKVTGADKVDPRAGFKDWLINVAASFVANHGLPYGEKLMKAVSHMGGVRVPAEQIKEIFRNGRGKQFRIKDFKDLKEFHYLTDEELADMLNRYQIRMERNDDVEYEDVAPEQEPADDDEDVNMAAKDEEMPKNDDAMRDEVNSSRGKIADAIGFIYNASEEVQVCLYCGSIEHDHEECRHENKGIIKNAFQLIRDTMFPVTTEEEKKGDEEDEAPQEGDDAPTEKGFDDEEEEEEEIESPPEHMYESPLFMSRVGDQDEYGSYCIDGFLLAQGGPTTHDEIMEIAKEAMMKGRGDRWSWADFWDSYPEHNRDIEMYKRVKLPEGCWSDHMFLQIIPTTGDYFFGCDYYDGVKYAPKSDPWLDPYEYQLSFDINSVLRHQVGRTSGHTQNLGLKCDDSGWVMLEDFLDYESMWRIHRLRHDHIPFRSWDNRNQRWRINYEEGRYRLRILMKIMHSCVVRGHRVRIQILALGVNPTANLEMPYCVRKRILSPDLIPQDGLLVEPIAVRAPSGHSKSAFGEVKLKEEMLSSPMTPGFVAALPECYHETDRNLLMQIWQGGIKPGAGAEQGRICTFFNVFPPWDSRSWKIVKGTARHRSERAVFYIPTEVLMQEFEGRVTASGQPVTTIASRLTRSEARLCATAVGEEDAEAAEILDIVVGLETKVIRPFKMTKEEVEEAENTPFEGEKADDEEMKDEEPSEEVKMETDEVNVDDQFDEVHRDLGSFSFNEEEVDYDEDEEEDMEVEEETEESKMRPMYENADDDRVVGDDDDRLRELAEERVRAQQERNSRYPKWAQPLEIGIKKMPEAYEGVGNIDPDEVSPQILDNTLMVFIAGYYDAYYKYRTETDADTRYEWTINQNDRLDLDKLAPMNGFHDDGSLQVSTDHFYVATMVRQEGQAQPRP
eukprot:s354_g26.t1